MQAPRHVQQAVNVIWATLAMSATSAVLAVRFGYTSAGEMSLNLLIYAVLCILPYKIGNRSNAARYIYAVLCALSFLVMLAGVAKLSPPDLISSILQVPLAVFALYQLFRSESTEWFTTSASAPAVSKRN